jgi:membrane associated rhomboid family serine protease
MFIPWNTDAPIYHFPYATIGLIVVNTVAFFAALSAADPVPWMLAFGDGLHPVQWLTNLFMHADLMHLLGNMIFLWAFGLVIEGKIGWWRFLLVYLGLGIFESAVSQIGMLGGEGLALGASGAIYGLLAMALVWAPRNSMNCLLFIFYRPFHVDFPILGFVALYVGWEVVIAGLTNFQMSSSMLHLAGALPGFVVAVAMLKLDLVDCENWDIFAVLGKREGKEKMVKPDPKRAATLQKNRESLRATALAHFAHHLREGRAAEALALHEKMTHTDGQWQLSQPQRIELVKALHKGRLWSQSVMPMVEFLRHAPDAAPRVRLKLAQILIVHEKRPGRALSVLEKIPAGSLGGDLEKARQQLEAQARKLYDEGEIEVETDDW